MASPGEGRAIARFFLCGFAPPRLCVKTFRAGGLILISTRPAVRGWRPPRSSIPIPQSGPGAKEMATSPVDVPAPVKHYFTMSTLAEIEQAAEKLSPPQKQKLMQFLGARLRGEANGNGERKLSPAERAADLQRWAASHERGPGLPDSAIGRDAIYD